MQMQQLLTKITEYSMNVLVGKAKSWTAKFAIGAGTEAIVSRAEGFIRASGTVDGDEVDLVKLHNIVSSGFKSAGHLDLLGGLIGFDPSDVDDLFVYLGK